MPTSVTFNGVQVYRPGTYITVNDNLSAPAELTGGNVAVVGDFPILAKATPKTFASYDSALAFLGYELLPNSSNTYEEIARVVFTALSAVNNAQADSLTLVNARNVSQASATFNGLKLSAQRYGTAGNRLRVDLSANADEATKWDIAVREQGSLVESFTAVGDDNYASISYSGATYSAVTAQVTSSNFELIAEQTLAEATIVGTVNGSGEHILDLAGLPVEGTVSFTIGGDLSAATSVNVTGIKADGTEGTVEYVLSESSISGDETGNVVTLAQEWQRLDSMAITSAASFVGDLLISMQLRKTALSAIDNLDPYLFAITEDYPGFSVSAPPSIITGAELDAGVSAVAIDATAYTFKRDVSLITSLVNNNSNYVSAERVSNAALAVASERLVGGALGALASADFQDALDAILYLPVNIVVPFTTDIAYHQLVKQHTRDAETKAGLERNAWVGAPALSSIATTANSYVNVLNDRNVSVVNQGIELADGTQLSSPAWLALMLAGVQAATDIAEPLTRKALPIVNTMQSYEPENVANEAIRKGIVIVTAPAGNGHRVERSVTSYRTNPNQPVFTEVSANESLNTCVRAVRSAVDSAIGSKATLEQADAIKNIALTTLTDLRDRAIIFNFRNLSVALQGDKINVIFDLAAQEPLNFITVTTNLYQE
jgi:hypothetical protein